MNKVIITGRMTKKAEKYVTTTGKEITKCTLAVDRPYLNDEGKRDADFFGVVIWGEPGNYFMEHTDKGTAILVEGRIQNRNYDAKDGSKHYVTEIIAQHFEIITRRTITAETPTEKTNEE